jgi:hypothetical protein
LDPLQIARIRNYIHCKYTKRCFQSLSCICRSEYYLFLFSFYMILITRENIVWYHYSHDTILPHIKFHLQVLNFFLKQMCVFTRYVTRTQPIGSSLLAYPLSAKEEIHLRDAWSPQGQLVAQPMKPLSWRASQETHMDQDRRICSNLGFHLPREFVTDSVKDPET